MPSEVIYVTTYDPALTHLGGAAYIDSRQIAGLRAAGMSVEAVQSHRYRRTARDQA